LDYHLDTLLTKAECGPAWTSFAETINSTAFGALPLGEQTKVSFRIKRETRGRSKEKHQRVAQMLFAITNVASS